MRVREIPGERLRFHVISQTRQDLVHLVDLEEWGGSGVCSCETFTFRTLPKVRAGIKQKGHGTDCKHLIAAKVFFAQAIVRKILQVSQAARALPKGERYGVLKKENTGSGEPDF